MEPFLTYALISTAINLVAKPAGELISNKLSGKKQEAFELKDYQHQLDLNMLRATREYDLQGKQQLQQESYAQRLQEAKYQYEIQIKRWQDQSFDQRVWPLKTPYENFSLKPASIPGEDGYTVIPCRIFTAKSSKNQEYSRFLETTVNVNLSMFLEKGYRLGDTHPTVSNIGDWKSDEYQEDIFINALWHGLQGQPVIVLNPVTTDNGSTINLRVTFWGLGTCGGYSTPHTTTVTRLDIGRERGLLIREESKYALECGLTNISQELKFNYDLIQSEENAPADKREGLMEKNIERYRLASEVVNTVNRRTSKTVSEIMCCFTGLYCDIYHLIEYGTPPIMPEKMLEYSPEYRLPAEFGKLYHGTLARLALSGYHGKNIKGIYIKTALSLVKHPSLHNQACEIIKEGVGLWIAEKAVDESEIIIPTSLESCVDLLSKYGIQPEEAQFYKDIVSFLQNTGNSMLAEKLCRVMSANLIKGEPQGINKKSSGTNIKGRLEKPKTETLRIGNSDDIFVL